MGSANSMLHGPEKSVRVSGVEWDQTELTNRQGVVALIISLASSFFKLVQPLDLKGIIGDCKQKCCSLRAYPLLDQLPTWNGWQGPKEGRYGKAVGKRMWVVLDLPHWCIRIF